MSRGRRRLHSWHARLPASELAPGGGWGVHPEPVRVCVGGSPRARPLWRAGGQRLPLAQLTGATTKYEHERLNLILRQFLEDMGLFRGGLLYYHGSWDLLLFLHLCHLCPCLLPSLRLGYDGRPSPTSLFHLKTSHRVPLSSSHASWCVFSGATRSLRPGPPLPLLLLDEVRGDAQGRTG